MADPLLPVAVAAAISHPGSEVFYQNIVHTDRHNIPNHPIQQKVDNEPTADPALDPFHDTDSELDIDTPMQEPPPPYSQPPQLLFPPTLSQPTAELPQIQAQAPPQLVGQPQQLPQAHLNVQQPDEEPPQPIQDWPGRLQDPESDPLFKCLLAQDQNTGDCCSISFPKFYLRLNRLYAREMKLLGAPSGLVNRLGNLANSSILQRAFIAGWAMLTTFAFPLIPSHALRCIWAVGQFVFALLSFILSCSIAKYNCDSVWSWAQFVITFSAFLLATLDMVSCLYVAFKQRHETEAQEGERQPLIRNEQIQSSRLKKWLWRYNDLLRLIINEVVGYGIVLTSLVSVDSEFRWNYIVSYCPNSTEKNKHTNLRLILLTASLFGFGVFVYIVQYMVICRMLYIRWWMRPKSSERCKGTYLIIMFLLFYTGHRITQSLGLATIGIIHADRDSYFQADYEQIFIIVGTCTCLLLLLFWNNSRLLYRLLHCLPQGT